MVRRAFRVVWLCVLTVAACSGAAAAPAPGPGSQYEELAALFADWRAFQRPVVVDGVPDYSEAAMAAQRRGLAGCADSGRDRHARVAGRRQVDWHLVRAEMNGLASTTAC